MAARYLVRRDSETLTCDTPLEFDRKEPIIATNEDARRYGRPTRKVALRVEHRLGLTWLPLRPGLVNYRLRHVVKEFEHGIERRVGITAVAPVLLALGLVVAGVPPPLANGLARLGDHRIDHHQQRDRDLFADQWRGEAAKRLGHEHQPPPLPL